MNGLIPLSLSLLLGQTEPSAGSTATSETRQLEAQLTLQQQELEELRAQVESLQAQWGSQQLQQEEAQERLETLEQQHSSRQAAAQQLEDLRLQRLDSLDRGYQWLILVAQQLEAGELSVAPALASAWNELSAALASATDTGHGETEVFIQSAMNRLATVNEAVAQRDFYRARLQVEDAGFELRAAWQMSLNRSGTTLVNP